MLLQAAAGGENGYATIIMLVGFVVIFYFFMLRPQQQKMKKQKKFMESLKRGMKVVTGGGIHGTITDVSADTVMIEVDKGFRLKVNKASIAYEQGKEEEKKD